MRFSSVSLLLTLACLFSFSPAWAADANVEATEFREISQLYQQKAYDAVIERLKRFEETYPRGAQEGQAHNLHGLSLLLTGHPAEAIFHFQKAIAANPRSENFNQYVRYNLATAQFESDRADDALQTLNGVRYEALDRDNRIKVRYLKSRILSKRGNWMDSARELLAAGRDLPASGGGNTEEIRKTFTSSLEQAVNEIKETSGLETLFREYEDSSFVDYVLFQIGSRKLQDGDRDKGEALLRALMSRFPSSAHYSKAAEIVRSLQDQKNAETDKMAIGVLLPIRGKFAKIGSRCLQSIELAFRIFDRGSSGADGKSRYTLVIEDAGDEPEQTLAALNKLVSKHHVVAVIGPLLAKGIDQITQRAQEMGVPLISLARYPGIAGDFIFQGGLTLKLQAMTVAKYAVEKMGVKKFAIVHPRDKVGDEVSNHFWDAVESLGGQIVGIESYNPTDTDFRQPIDKLSGLYYTDARQREVAALTKAREENNIKKRTRKTEQFFALKPIVDYQAVFIPEEPRIAGQIMPTFAYRDVDHVQFLGTSAWNSPELASRAQNYAENSVFVDAFFPNPQNQAVRKFMDRYKATFDQEPSSLEALAYDAGVVLENVLNRGASTRSSVRDALLNLHNIPGATGNVSYKDGYLQRELKILTIKGGKIMELGSS